MVSVDQFKVYTSSVLYVMVTFYVDYCLHGVLKVTPMKTSNIISCF